jgi:L-aminopeptidase/D-esterase-like protein
VHTMLDGDTVFSLATGDRPAPDPVAFHALLSAAGDTVTRAVTRGVWTADSLGGLRGYREAFPSACV